LSDLPGDAGGKNMSKQTLRPFVTRHGSRWI